MEVFREINGNYMMFCSFFCECACGSGFGFIARVLFCLCFFTFKTFWGFGFWGGFKRCFFRFLLFCRLFRCFQGGLMRFFFAFVIPKAFWLLQLPRGCNCMTNRRFPHMSPYDSSDSWKSATQKTKIEVLSLKANEIH